MHQLSDESCRFAEQLQALRQHPDKLTGLNTPQLYVKDESPVQKDEGTGVMDLAELDNMPAPYFDLK